MGAALETITAYASPAGTTAGTYVALTPQSGQSLTIRATPTDQAGEILAPFASCGLASYVQLKSARMHDQTIGCTFLAQINTTATAVSYLAGLDWDEPAWNTDVLTFQFTPVATNTNTVPVFGGFSIYYPSLGGINQNMMTWAQVKSYENASAKTGLHYVSWVVAASGATAGHLGAAVAINNVNDQFKANHSYALLGYNTNTSCGAVIISGTDTGNLYVGGVGSLNPAETRNYFVDLSLAQGIPCIPIIQANNKGGTFVYVADPATTSTNFEVQLNWMDLGINVPPVGT